jgi:hypothetical protein
MLPAVQATLAGNGNRKTQVKLGLATWPRELVLLGAARYAHASCRTGSGLRLRHHRGKTVC